MLELEQVSLRVGARNLLQQLDWRVEAGQRWALLGRNGSGKTTLLRCLAGLQAPSSGRLRLHGQPMTSWSAAQLAGLRALLPAQPVDRFTLDVLDSVQLVQPLPCRSAALELLAALDAEQLAGADLLQLSAGERQRVGLAQALAQQAELLLLDEPVSFQDPAHQARIAQLLRQRRTGAQVLVAHDLNWVARVATHVLALLGDGHWLAGSVEEMLQPQPLQAIYRCPWQRLDGPDGAYWVTP